MSATGAVIPSASNSPKRPAAGIPGAVALLISAACVAISLIAIFGGAQYRLMRTVTRDGGNFTLSAKTPLGPVFRYLDVYGSEWSWRSGIPLAALLLPAQSVELRKRCTDRDLGCVMKMPWLTQLSIRGAHVTNQGMRPLGGLKRLRTMRVYGVQITGSGLRGLGRLRSLRKLILEKTSVGDRVFRLVASLDKLQSLTLAGDKRISGAKLENIPGPPQLEYLALSVTHFGDAGLHWVGKLGNLRYLYLVGDGQVTDRGLKPLAGLVKLRYLDIHGTNITDGAIPWIEAIRSLRSVDLGKTRLTSQGIAALRRARPMMRISLR